MILYDYWRSSSAWRVRIALHFKGIAFERRVVNLIKDGGEQHGADFHALNPLAPGAGADRPTTARAPSRSRWRSSPTWKSAFRRRRCCRRTPWLRARARQLAEMVNAGIQPLQNLAVLDHVQAGGMDRNEWARHFIARGPRGAGGRRARDGGRVPGRRRRRAWPTLYLIPQLYNARRFDVDLAPLPDAAAGRIGVRGAARLRRRAPRRAVGRGADSPNVTRPATTPRKSEASGARNHRYRSMPRALARELLRPGAMTTTRVTMIRLLLVAPPHRRRVRRLVAARTRRRQSFAPTRSA